MKRKKNKKACHFTTPYHPYINSRIQTVAVEIVGLEDNSYHLIVPVEINGIQGDMIIDTGASVTVVDRQVFPEDLPEEADVQMTSGSVTGQIHDVHLVKAVFEITVINAQKTMYKKCLEESIKMNGGVEPKIYTD